MTRNRHIIEPPRGDGAPCQPQDKEVVQPCNTQPCSTGGTCQNGKWGVWADWSPCSVTCGGGTTFRNRKIVQMANACGRPVTGKDRESMFCMTMPCAPAVNCEFSSWGAWSDCSGSCNGIKTRERGIGKYGQGNGSYCEGALKQTFPCNVISSKPDGPAVDCEIGEWEPWTKCTQPCGSEQKMRHRKILHLAENGGLSCDGDLSVVQGCGGPCPGPTPCLLGEWGEWARVASAAARKSASRVFLNTPHMGARTANWVQLRRLRIALGSVTPSVIAAGTIGRTGAFAHPHVATVRGVAADISGGMRPIPRRRWRRRTASTRPSTKEGRRPRTNSSYQRLLVAVSVLLLDLPFSVRPQFSGLGHMQRALKMNGVVSRHEPVIRCRRLSCR